MESALTITPRSFSASSSASADLPLAVGPAIRMISGSLTTLTYCAFPRIKILQELKSTRSDPHKALSRIAAGAGTRRRNFGPALRRLVQRRSAQAGWRQALELPPRLQGGDRPACGDRSLRCGGLCQSGRKFAAHDRRPRAHARRQALLLRVPADVARPCGDRLCGGGVGCG